MPTRSVARPVTTETFTFGQMVALACLWCVACFWLPLGLLLWWQL